MPVVTAAPQNTRTGLISWLVVFVILFVVAAIFAIYYDVEFNHAEQARNDLTKKYSTAVSEIDVGNPEISKMLQGRGPGTAIQRLLTQRDNAARIITGNDKAAANDFADVTSAVTTNLEQIQNQLKTKNVSVSLPGDNLIQGMHLLASQVVASQDAVAKAEADAKAANDKVLAATKERDALLAEKDKQIAALQADIQKGQVEEANYREGKEKNVSDIEQSAKLKIQELQGRLDAAQNDVAKRQTEIASLQHVYDAMKQKLSRLRLNPSDSVLQPDGYVTRVPGKDTVFISIGQGESVTPGLTFEIYDQHKGLPKLTAADSTNDTDLPAGKASIQVMRVMPGTSECRVIKTAVGQQIVIGDLIENLIYDPNTKYNFVVYGAFDLAQTGNATPADTEVVRRLITQWGGKVQNEVNVDTDFVVLGKEPVVPALSAADQGNALAQRRFEEAQHALDAYQDVKSQAIKLGIPILNQNRFLYFIGYFDQAKR